MHEYNAAGIDIGTVSIAIVLHDRNWLVTYRDYRLHNGNIYAALEDMLAADGGDRLVLVRRRAGGA